MDEAAHIETEPGSERSFGLVFAGVFGLIALWPLVQGGTPRGWALAVALGFAALALLAPRVLARPNALWFRLGLLLGAVVAPVIMVLVYAVAVVPLGALRRLRRLDSLDSRFEPAAESYWKTRERAPQPLDRQF